MAKRKVRPIRVEGNAAYIPLSRGLEAIIDAEDIPIVSGRNWFARKSRSTFYAYANVRKPCGRQTSLILHRVIYNSEPRSKTDHKDGDGLNCRRSNLRAATQSQNMCNRGRPSNNTSGHKGVSWHARDMKWQARIKYRGKTYHLGNFDGLEQASKAYAAAASRLHGDFAKTN